MRPLWNQSRNDLGTRRRSSDVPPLWATGRTTGGARSRRWRLSGSRPRSRSGGRTTGSSGEAGAHSRRWGAGESELPLCPWPAAARTTGTARLELPVMVMVMVAVATPEDHRGGKEQGRRDEDDSGDNHYPGGDTVE